MFSSRNKDKTLKKSKDVIDHTVDGVDQAQGTTAAATGGGAGADASGGRAHVPQPQRYSHQELIDGINHFSTIISISNTCWLTPTPTLGRIVRAGQPPHGSMRPYSTTVVGPMNRPPDPRPLGALGHPRVPSGLGQVGSSSDLYLGRILPQPIVVLFNNGIDSRSPNRVSESASL